MSTHNPESYKARKEAFVSNLSGSSLTDINLVTLVAPAAVLLWTALQKRQSFFGSNDATSLVVDFMLNVCAILFAFTAYSSAPVLLNVFLAVPAVFLLLPLLPEARRASRTGKGGKTRSSAKKDVTAQAVVKLPNRPFITHYRGAMMIATCVAILAVDFPVFPRRFAKVETWGTSLMDLGVGSFVFSAGVVSARQILSPSGSSSARRPLIQRLVGSVRHSTPLFVLGFIRLWSVKGLDYAEHVTEYGVHWNFFFTLGLLPPFVELSDSLTQYVFRSYDVLAVFIAILYEVVLNSTDLLPFILISPRGPSLLSKNREGVFSFIGYLAVFISGRSTGTHILPFQAPATSSLRITSPGSSMSKDRMIVLRNLLIAALVYVALFTATTSYWGGNVRVSRRLANAPYVFWIAAYNNAQLLMFAIVEHVGPEFFHLDLSSAGNQHKQSQSLKNNTPDDSSITPEDATSTIMQAFNRNGLAIFLIANLLTGLVNLTFDTLDARNATAMGILLGYTAVLAVVAVGLAHAGIRIKL